MKVYEDSVIVEVFKGVAPKEKRTQNNLPRFSIIGKENKFYLGIGGYLKGVTVFDFGSPISTPNHFVTSQIPVPKVAGNGGLLQLSAAASTIYLNFVALPGTKHQIGTYINFNFMGGNGLDYDFDLLYAYLMFYNFSFGYNFTLFADTEAVPLLIDTEGPSSLPTTQSAIMNYTYNVKNWSMAAGLEIQLGSFSNKLGPKGNYYTSSINQRLPSIPLYLQYGFGENSKNGHIRASAVLRDMQYRDAVSGKNRGKFGWGVQLSGLVNTNSNSLEFFYQAVYGKGITSYYQDCNGLGEDFVPSTIDGKLTAVKSWGGYLGATINYTKNLCTSLMYSQVRLYPQNNFSGWDNLYRYAQYGLCNLIWTPKSYLQVGLEYLYGRKVLMSHEKAHDNRIQGMIQISF